MPAKDSVLNIKACPTNYGNSEHSLVFQFFNGQNSFEAILRIVSGTLHRTKLRLVHFAFDFFRLRIVFYDDGYPSRKTNVPCLSAQLMKIEILTSLWTSEFDYFTRRKTVN